MCGFSWFLNQYCMIAPIVLANVYALATLTWNHKDKINLNYNGATVEVFFVEQWTLFVVRRQVLLIRKFRISPSLSNRIESNRNRPIRIRIESRSFAGPYVHFCIYIYINIYIYIYVQLVYQTAMRTLNGCCNGPTQHVDNLTSPIMT